MGVMISCPHTFGHVFHFYHSSGLSGTVIFQLKSTLKSTLNITLPEERVARNMRAIVS